MNTCKECGTQFEGNFCPQCGAKVVNGKVCSACGAQVDNSAKFCNICGHNFSADDKQIAATESVTAEPRERKRPAPVVKERDSARICKIATQTLSIINKYVFALFALLVWAFFAAQFGSLMGFGLGNVYSSLGGMIDDFKPIAIASVVFGAAGFVYIAAVIASSFSYAVQDKRVGKFALTDILCLASCVFYVVFFALGCASLTKSNQLMMEGNVYGGIVIAFSLLFLLVHAGAFFADILLTRNVSLYGDVHNQLQQARQQMFDERKAQAVQALANNGLTEPEPVAKLVAPYKSLSARVKEVNSGAFSAFCAFAIATLLLVVAIIVVAAVPSLKEVWSNFGDGAKSLTFLPIGVTLLCDVVVIIRLLCPRRLKEVDEASICTKIKRDKTAFIVCCVAFLCAVVVVGAILPPLETYADKKVKYYQTYKENNTKKDEDGNLYVDFEGTRYWFCDGYYEETGDRVVLRDDITYYEFYGHYLTDNQNKEYYEMMDRMSLTDVYIDEAGVKYTLYEEFGLYEQDGDGFIAYENLTSHRDNSAYTYYLCLDKESNWYRNDFNSKRIIDKYDTVYKERRGFYNNNGNDLDDFYSGALYGKEKLYRNMYWNIFPAYIGVGIIGGIFLIVACALSVEFVCGQKLNKTFGLYGKRKPNSAETKVGITLEELIEMQQKYDDYCYKSRLFKRNVYRAMRGKSPILSQDGGNNGFNLLR